jgi:polysaccharide pyruvyl transferase WcaK-like protein
MSDKKKIGLIGYYGYGNYGDELFKEVFSSALPEYELITLQDSLHQRPFYKGGEKGLKKKIEKVDAVLIGGGDLIIPYYWTDQYFENAFLDKPIFMHGLGVPTWGGYDAEVVGRLKSFFQSDSIKHIHVRDVESEEWIIDHLQPRIAIDRSPDIVCALPLPHVERPDSPPIFGIITRKQMPGEINWDNIKALIAKARDLGYTIRHITAATGDIGREDDAVAEEFSFENMEMIRTENIQDITKAIGECTVLASMKFHGLVVASMFGIPTIGLITTDKFRNLYTIMDRKDLSGHHIHSNLPDRLQKYMASIPYFTHHALREKATYSLGILASRIKSTIG